MYQSLRMCQPLEHLIQASYQPPPGPWRIALLWYEAYLSGPHLTHTTLDIFTWNSQMNLHIHDPSGLNLRALIKMWVWFTWAAGHHLIITALCWPRWVDLWGKYSVFLTLRRIISHPVLPYLVANLPVFSRMSCLTDIGKGQMCFLCGFILLSARGLGPNDLPDLL